MVRCKEVSTMLSTSTPPAELSRRLTARLHLAVCRDCRAFRRQLLALGTLAQESGSRFDAELSPDFEAHLVRGLANRDESA
jgi:hypothetical protein